MKPPACEAVWEMKLGQKIRFDKVWKIKADYVSPRDQIVWLKIEHRNLWVAASGGMHGSTKCNAAGCNEEEKQEHLVRCPTIRREFWDKVATLMGRLKGLIHALSQRLIFSTLTHSRPRSAWRSVSPLMPGKERLWRCLHRV